MKKLKKIFLYSISGITLIIIIFIALGHTNIGNKNLLNYPEFKVININGEQIRFSQKGQGNDILLIHGNPGSLEDWNGIVDSLAKDYKVTCFDRLGHGYSSSNEYSYHLKDNAILIEHLIDKLKLENPLIVGHSYGGSIAAYMAVNLSLKEVEYIIIDSPLYNNEPSTIYKLLSIPVLGKGIAFLANYTIASNQFEKALNSLFESLPSNQIDILVKERKEIWGQPKVLYSKSKESVNIQIDLNQIYSKYKYIESDITLVTGKHTIMTFRNDCEKFHSEVDKTELVILDKTGHYIQFDKPNEVIEIIREKMK